MKKYIAREFMFLILLILVVVITLRMVIYDFIPEKDMLPEMIKYIKNPIVETVLSEIRFEEVQSTTGNNVSESLLKTYKIEESDLKNNFSKKGKVNPFED